MGLPNPLGLVDPLLLEVADLGVDGGLLLGLELPLVGGDEFGVDIGLPKGPDTGNLLKNGMKKGRPIIKTKATTSSPPVTSQ